MISLFIYCSVFILLAGGLWKTALDKFGSGNYRITKTEFLISSALLLAVIVPVTSWAGTNIAVHNKTTFNENWGGFETNTIWGKTGCSRDGSCIRTYSCDPYTVMVTYSYPCGKSTCHGVRPETHYHSCPYTTEEWEFYIDTTLGRYTVAEGNLPTNPTSHRWRESVDVPSDIPSGIPVLWSEAKARIDSGNPGPVTVRKSYQNYVLASHDTILKKYDGAVKKYSKLGLLPKLSTKIYDLYQLPRVYLMSGISTDKSWDAAANQLAAAVGWQLHGDVHVVFVGDAAVPSSSADEYFGALQAWWQSKTLGRDALSKNAIFIAAGTYGGSITWARAGTGMPVGNEGLAVAIKSALTGAPFDVNAIFGHPKAQLVGGKIVGVIPGKGALPSAIWGPNKFQRVCMTCVTKGEKGSGFSYLRSEIQPDSEQRHWIIGIAFLFGLIAWGICAVIDVPSMLN